MQTRFILRLVSFAFLLFIAGALIFYQTRPVLAYALYRCLMGAESVIACIDGKPTAFKTTMFGMVYEGNTADLLDRHVLGFGAYEKPELFFLRDVSRDGVFVDVGANKGVHSLFMSKYCKEVHAFEPYEPVLKRLRQAIEANSIKNIFVHPVGLGDKAQRLIFEEPAKDNEGTGSFAFISGSGKHQQLEIVPGDQALEAAGVKIVDLIKMDIEGFERPALEGLRKTLAQSRPIVVVEITVRADNPVLFKSMEQIRSTFPDKYEFFEFGDRNLYTGSYTIDPLDGSINFASQLEQHNVIAVPTEKKSSIPLKGPVKNI
ncbi:MAG TPA: FkbM family methyltransferase [Candidatus Binatia bacterium]